MREIFPLHIQHVFRLGTKLAALGYPNLKLKMKHITNLVVKLIQEKEREGERTNVSGLDCWKQGQ